MSRAGMIDAIHRVLTWARELIAQPEPEGGVASDPEPAPARSPALDSALNELRCALALFEVADELDQLRLTNDYVMPHRERLAHVYATWSLARAANRFWLAYGREVGTGEAP